MSRRRSLAWLKKPALPSPWPTDGSSMTLNYPPLILANHRRENLWTWRPMNAHLCSNIGAHSLMRNGPTLPRLDSPSWNNVAMSQPVRLPPRTRALSLPLSWLFQKAWLSTTLVRLSDGTAARPLPREMPLRHLAMILICAGEMPLILHFRRRAVCNNMPQTSGFL